MRKIVTRGRMNLSKLWRRVEMFITLFLWKVLCESNMSMGVLSEEFVVQVNRLVILRLKVFRGQ